MRKVCRDLFNRSTEYYQRGQWKNVAFLDFKLFSIEWIITNKKKLKTYLVPETLNILGDAIDHPFLAHYQSYQINFLCKKFKPCSSQTLHDWNLEIIETETHKCVNDKKDLILNNSILINYWLNIYGKKERDRLSLPYKLSSHVTQVI